MVRSTADLSGPALTEAIDRAHGCLRRNFRAVQGASGWYHYLDDPSPGVTASAVGLYAFSVPGVIFERTPDVLRFLVSQQVSSADRRDGGWSVRTTNGFPVAEATAWVVRALSRPEVGPLSGGDSLRRGAEWIKNNQNVDFGWGSHFGQPSRVFLTALNMLALHECGGDRTALSNAQRWLIDAQSPSLPAWGSTPGGEPTLVHTSIALMALANIPGALSVNSMRQTAEWLLEKLEPGVHVERSTTVEEYDVPYPQGDTTAVFQNSLPHFAGPLAVAALVSTGAADPLQAKLFNAIQGILDTQQEGGHWELPRSPVRPSIWAIWPFVSALTLVRSAVFTTPNSRATLLFPGCVIIQNDDVEQRLTRRLLIKNALFDWLRAKWITVVLLLTSMVATGVPLALLLIRKLSTVEFLMALIIPVLLMVFDYARERRSVARGR
ncbi:prenyltransferase/squalene oxidase repeat-containing protein [Streptomyces sp. NPDC020681]|uniref:prenyltransferase/squalene oxidase repeat-containing protein n=1 Tax=Streptomyces sp. NPDC020681 TaxID=3365083 RepID=UPI00379852DF